MTGLASASKQKHPVSPASPRSDVLQPKPPPAVALHDNRPALLGKTRHRISLKATKLPGSSPHPPHLQELDLENSRNHPLFQISSASSGTVSSSSIETKMTFVGSPNCKLKESAQAGHFTAAPIPLIPAPPVGQRGSSRGLREGRRIAFHQTGNLLSAT